MSLSVCASVYRAYLSRLSTYMRVFPLFIILFEIAPATFARVVKEIKIAFLFFVILEAAPRLYFERASDDNKQQNAAHHQEQDALTRGK